MGKLCLGKWMIGEWPCCETIAMSVDTKAGYTAGSVPAIAAEAVLVKSEGLKGDTVGGYNFDKGVDYAALLDSYVRTGYQATNLGLAIQEIERMLDWSLADEPIADDEEDEFKDMEK